MGGLQPLERQWIIFRTLISRRYGVTVKDLAEDLSVSLKTIRRDLELLRNLGFPIAPRAGSHGRNHWIAEAGGNVPNLTFDISEILSLYLGKTLMEPFVGTVLWESHQSAFRKIKAQLKEPVRKYLDHLRGTILQTSFRNSNYADKSQIIDDLMVAIEERRITFLTYQSARSTEPLTYDVYPYGLVYHRGSLYLIAHSQQHSEIRTFKIDRVSGVALETLTFQKPAQFDLRDYMRQSIGIFHSDGDPQKVIIRFHSTVAQYLLEHQWHPSQKLTKLKDGSIRAEFELNSFEELKSWVLSFGSKAIVLTPESLREEIRQEIAIMNRNYSNTAPSGV